MENGESESFSFEISSSPSSSPTRKFTVEIPEIPSPFIADVIDDPTSILAFTPLPAKLIQSPPKPSKQSSRLQSPLMRRMKRVVVKDIFETPQKIVNYSAEPKTMFFQHHVNDEEKLKRKEVFKRKHKIYPLLSIARRHNLVEETPYRKIIGQDIRKISPVKHVPRKRHVVLRNKSEKDVFHNINQPRQEDGRTPLYLAAMKGHTKSVRLFYFYGADVNLRVRGKFSWEYGKSPLYIAAEKGHLLTVKALLKLGAKVDLPDHRGRTPIYAAAESGQAHMVHLLVHFGGSNVNHYGNEGESPLFAAALNGHVDTVFELLKMGANVNSQRHDGWSPIHAASHNGHLLVVQKLIDFGANVNVATVGHRTPLSLAQCKDHKFSKKFKGVIKILKAHGALSQPTYILMRNACAEGNAHKLHELIRFNNADVNLTRQDGVSPIWIASQNGHYDCVKILIENGANVHQATVYGDTALDIALQEGHFKIVRVLRELGANGWNYAHIACEDGDADRIRELAKLSGDEYVDFDRPDDDGWSPAHVAVENHKYEALRALSSVGADVNQPDLLTKGKRTPLDIAIYKGIVEGQDKWKPIIIFLRQCTLMETQKTAAKRAEKMAAYVIQRHYRKHKVFLATVGMLKGKESDTKNTRKQESDLTYIPPKDRIKKRPEPIDDLLRIDHSYLI